MLNALERPSLLKDLEVQLMKDSRLVTTTRSDSLGFQVPQCPSRAVEYPGCHSSYSNADFRRVLDLAKSLFQFIFVLESTLELASPAMAQDPCVGECVKAIRRCSDLSPDPEQIRRCHCVIGDCASTVPVSCLLEHIASAAFPSLMKMTILTPLDLNATPTVSRRSIQPNCTGASKRSNVSQASAAFFWHPRCRISAPSVVNGPRG